MGNRDYLKLGDYNAVCDRCNFKYKASELLEEWTGLKVCSLCWEPRHPQDFIRSKPDQQPLPWTRPEPADVFIGSSSGIACDAQEFMPLFPVPIVVDTTIAKRYSYGTVEIQIGTLTVVCTLEVR